MNASGGALQQDIPAPGLGKLGDKSLIDECAPVIYIGGLMVPGDIIIALLNPVGEMIHQSLPFEVDEFACFCQLAVQDIQQLIIWPFSHARIFQVTVSLHKDALIHDQLLQIKWICLGQQNIHEFPSFRAGSGDDGPIVRSHHDYRIAADMTGIPAVWNIIQPEILFSPNPHRATDPVMLSSSGKISFYAESFRIKLHAGLIRGMKITSGAAQVMYGIQQGGLPGSVRTGDGRNLPVKAKCLLPVVFKTGQGNMVDGQQESQS